MPRIRDSVVVITGASSGIGRACAFEFAGRGAAVVLAARREEPLEELAAACRKRTGLAVAVPTDVTDENAVRELARRTVEQFGRIDVWVNNAAVSLVGRFLEAPPEVFRQVIETNLFGYIHGARAALPYFHEQGRGVLINNATVFGRVGPPFLTAYVTSKFGILGFTESLRQEVRRDGIRVCAVLPASIDTPIFQHAANFSGRAVRPLDPVSSPTRVARAIVRCARHPRAEVVVGRGARRMLVARLFLRPLAERALAHEVERNHFEAWPVAPSTGNLFALERGTDSITGGWGQSRRGTTQAALLASLLVAAALGVTRAVVKARRPVGWGSRLRSALSGGRA
jgi:NAD(P)-dependent dehydrogenase (short-subunit alcohol dehydrogenase family)